MQECALKFFFGGFWMWNLCLRLANLVIMTTEQFYYLSSVISVCCNDGGGWKDASQRGCRGRKCSFFSPGFCGKGRVKPPTLPAFVSLCSVSSVRLRHPAACQTSPGLVLSHSGHRAGGGPPFCRDHRALPWRQHETTWMLLHVQCRVSVWADWKHQTTGSPHQLTDHICIGWLALWVEFLSFHLCQQIGLDRISKKTKRGIILKTANASSILTSTCSFTSCHYLWRQQWVQPVAICLTLGLSEKKSTVLHRKWLWCKSTGF